MRLFSRAASSLAVLLACLWAVVDAAGVLEIDLLFPRNETYAPHTRFPVIFALRNPHLAQHLRPEINWVILNASRSDPTSVRLADGKHRFFWTNETTQEPYFLYHFPNLRSHEGPVHLGWWANWISCNLSSSEPAFEVGETELLTLNIDFTVKSGGQSVDLVAATARNDEETCAQPGVAINVTDETRWVPDDPLDIHDYGDETCAVLASSSPTPTANPCHVEITSAAAESIWASLAADWCLYKPANDTSFDCAKYNAAERLTVAGVACLAAAFGAVGYLLF
jgi:hypothetical protein